MNNLTSIKYWAEDDRPREKLTNKGKHVLSDAELIAILIGSGTTEFSAVEVARKILALANNHLGELSKKSVSDFCKIKGIGPAKAITIVAAMELSRRRFETMALDKEKITCSKDAYHFFKNLEDLSHEEFWILLLNRSNKILGKQLISKGGTSGTVADPKLIYQVALQTKSCCAIILIHNHPSGKTTPSEADNRLTKKILNAGKLLDLPVLDHLIIADQGYYSFADEGNLG